MGKMQVNSGQRKYYIVSPDETEDEILWEFGDFLRSKGYCVSNISYDFGEEMSNSDIVTICGNNKEWN